MLTALTREGKKLSLGYKFKKETLIHLRSKEEFFCPVCGERVILKLGDSKIYHFAHVKGGACREFYENETETHMKGKLELFQWLQRQKIPAVLEYYDAEIQQRPDIFFMHHDQKFALEYQCSPISEEVFKKRTESYLAHHYIPLWILGKNPLKDKQYHSGGLTNFHYLFLRKTRSGKFFIPAFSPEKQNLQLLYSIFPYSIKKALLQKSIFPMNKITLQSLLEPELPEYIDPVLWRREFDQSAVYWSLTYDEKKRIFLNELYNARLNLSLFPPEIGLPVPHGLLLRSPPYIWQAYVYLDVLKNKQPGDLISIHQIEKSFEKRVKTGEILIRNLPQLPYLHPISAILDYFSHLQQLGILAKGSEKSFIVQKKLHFPVSIWEKDRMIADFYKQNHEIIIKSTNEKR